jgi:hypothetical protein
MYRQSVQFALFSDHQFQVLINVLSEKRYKWTQKYINFEQNIKENIKTNFCILIVKFSFDSWSIQPNVPICQVL